MELQLTPDQEALIRLAVSSGRYPTPTDAVRDAVERWEEAERARYELISALDFAETDLSPARGGGLFWLLSPDFCLPIQPQKFTFTMA